MNAQEQEIFKMQCRERFPYLPSFAYCASHFQFAVIMESNNYLSLKTDCISCAQVERVIHSSALMKSASKLLFCLSCLKKDHLEMVNSEESSELNK